MTQNLTRRRFVKNAVVAAATLPILAGALSSCESGGESLPEGQKELSESEPVAMAMGYKKDGAQVDTTKYPKKAGAAGAAQKCSNCAQYTAANGAWGKCNIFPQGLVAANGWCNTWAQKA